MAFWQLSARAFKFLAQKILEIAILRKILIGKPFGDASGLDLYGNFTGALRLFLRQYQSNFTGTLRQTFRELYGNLYENFAELYGRLYGDLRRKPLR